MSNPRGKVVSADLPPALWQQLSTFVADYPGMPRQATIKAALALALSQPEKLKELLGRY